MTNLWNQSNADVKMAARPGVLLLLMSIAPWVVWCEIPPNARKRQASTGDFIIGGVLPLHYSTTSNGPCSSSVSWWGLHAAEMMVFAINKINSNPAILPNCVIGYDIRTDCQSEEFTLYSTSSLATGAHPQTAGIPVGMIGPGTSVNAIFAGKVASLYRIPIISFSATSDELSNKARFPYFLRTAPPDKLQAQAMIDILLHYDWTYVALLYSADTYGIHGALEVLKLAEQNNICVAFSVAIRGQPSISEVNDIVSKLHTFRKATVIVIFSYSSRIYTVLRAFHAAYPHDRLICIGSDAFGGGYLQSYGLANSTVGSFFVVLMTTKIPKFEAHFQSRVQKSVETGQLSPWLTDYIDTWTSERNCSNLTLCPVRQTSDRNAVHSGVYALAHALHDFQQTYGNNNSCSNITGEMLLPYLYNVSFEGVGGYVHFDSEGNSGGKYKLKGLQLSPNGQFEQVEVGIWDSAKVGNNLDISEDVVQWPLGRRQPPLSVCREACRPGFIPIPLKEKCCWGCQACAINAIVVNGSFCEPCVASFWPNANRSVCEAIVPTSLDWKSSASVVIASVSTVGIISSVLTTAGLLYYRNHALVKATSRELSCINILGLTVAFASVFGLLARPSFATCSLSEAMISLSFTLIYAPTLLKVNRIFRIFQASRKSVRRPRFVGPKHQVIISAVFIVIQVILSVMSAVLGPSLPTLLIPSDLREYVELYCSFGTGFLVIVAYNLIIILACCFFAFKTRKVPSNYNESKFIAVSVYSTLVMFLAVMPVYATAVVVVQKVTTLCVALQINAYLTLVLVYLPKLYGIRFVLDLDVQEWRTNSTANQVGTSFGVETVSKANSAARVKPQSGAVSTLAQQA